MKFAFILSILVGFVSSSAFAQVWDFNEVSLLLPLPRAGEEKLMLSPRSAGSAQNELLPQQVYSRLPNIVIGASADAVYDALRVVAVRLDPCFTEGFAFRSTGCQRQVRFVWQPLMRTKSPQERGDFSTADAAVHTFYRLTDEEWNSLIRALRPLRQAYPLGPGLPLQIHPHIRTQGYRGEYWQRWTSIVLPLIGARNMVRATAMTVNPMGNVWVFTGFNIANGQMTRINVPRIDNQGQAFFAALDNTAEFRTQMNPAPQGQDAFQRLLTDSVKVLKEGREADIKEALRTALEIDNPTFHNPGTMDCASCHASRAVTHWARGHFPQWDWSRLFPRENFKGPGNLTNTSVKPMRTDILRAFGYFGTDPIISSRVINETSLVMGQMTASERRF